jgi:hypothetical protein
VESIHEEPIQTPPITKPTITRSPSFEDILTVMKKPTSEKTRSKSFGLLSKSTSSISSLVFFFQFQLTNDDSCLQISLSREELLGSIPNVLKEGFLLAKKDARL